MFSIFKKKQSKQPKTQARKLITIENPKAVISEQYKTIRTNINFSLPDQEIKTIVLTSSVPGEGKSTTSSNIAAVYAQAGKKVLLVDCDMRKPTIHHTFAVNNSLGLSTILTRQCTVVQAVHETKQQNLSVMTSGPIPPNPAELISSKMMTQIIAGLKEEFDLIIFDAPPVLAVTDAQILAHKCDGTILVVNAGETDKELVKKAKEALVKSNAILLGAVLNNFEMENNHYYYKYYGNAE